MIPARSELRNRNDCFKTKRYRSMGTAMATPTTGAFREDPLRLSTDSRARPLVGLAVVAVAAEVAVAEALAVWHYTRLAAIGASLVLFACIVSLAWFLLFARPRMEGSRRRASERAKRLHAVVDQAGDGLLIADDHDRVVLANAAAQAQFGYLGDEAIGWEVDLLLPREGPGDGSQELKVALGLEGLLPDDPAARLVRAIRKDGSTFPAEAATTPIDLGEGERVTVITIRDLGADLKVVRLAQSVRELERLSTVAADDLREPLEDIIELSETLRLGAAARLDDEAVQVLDDLANSVGRICRLVDSVGRSTEAIGGELRVESIPLGDLVQDVVDRAVDGQPDTPRVELGRLPTVEGDRRKLTLLFEALIDNALRYQRPGVDARVRIGSEQRRSEGEPHRITVEDNGIGFDMQFAERIFEVFRRLPSSRPIGGTGVGLAQCRQIAEQHGGTIRAVGRRDEGATFTVELPAAAGDDRRLVSLATTAV